jgi:hypothetical protein
LLSSLGPLTLERHWWGNRCACAPAGYASDVLLGIEGGQTRRVQQGACKLGADVSFAKAQEHLQDFWQIALSAETVRAICERHGQRMQRWQPQEQATPAVFAAAAGEIEFTVDAGKANTREEGWKDVKIAAFQKRPRAEPASAAQWSSRTLPEPTARVAWAAVVPAPRFCKGWRRWSRRLGVKQAAEVHTLADGAAWIWRGVERVLTGCEQTLDIYHACQHIAAAGERLHGEGSAAGKAFLERGRTLLLESGWEGITRLMAEELGREDTPRTRAVLEKMLSYFVKHLTRLNYQQRLAAGQAIGSGAIEGWAKTLGLRLKARGARWRQRNVNRMAALGCVRNSSQWSAYWSPN